MGNIQNKKGVKMKHIKIKDSINFWIREIPNSRIKDKYIRYRRLEKLAKYLGNKIEKNIIRKHLIVGQYYKYEFDNRTYYWSGNYMILVKKDGTLSQDYRYRKYISINQIGNYINIGNFLK